MLLQRPSIAYFGLLSTDYDRLDSPKLLIFKIFYQEFQRSFCFLTYFSQFFSCIELNFLFKKWK